MKINKIQLMQVLRNKRFLLFTVFVPVCWYAFFFNVQEDAVPSVVLGIAVFIGIIGNSLATFSKRVSANIDFYRFESSFTHYSLSRWLVAQSFVQLVLNALIFAVVFVCAILFFKFPVSAGVAAQFVLLMLMGVWFSFIGFVLGVRVDSKIIDTVSFPVIVVAAVTIFPFSRFGATGGFVDVADKVQMIFPGYWYSGIVDSLTAGSPVEVKHVLLFALTFAADLIPLYLLIPNSCRKINSGTRS